MTMIPVAKADNVTIKCPAEGRFSFFNSPYIAHRTFTGIDIYPPSDFGGSAPSPVLGKVVMIRKVKCPKSREFKASTYDYVILIESIENPHRMIKVLHVNPSVKVGDTVEPGQELGFLLRSGYFDFWTDPHIHVEIRKPEDPIRARGGLKLQSILKMKDLKIRSEGSLKGTVLTVKPEYLLILPEDNLRYGLTVEVGRYVGVIDGGIPHYGRFGVHIQRCSECLKGLDNVKLINASIGKLEEVYGGAAIAKCNMFSVHMGKIRVGLSLYVHPRKKPLIKVIPPKPFCLKVEEEEAVSISITNA